MGLLIYASSIPGIEFDDRALAHLKIVIFAKLRRQESFGFSWNTPVTLGGGRGAIWLSPSVPVQFMFFGSKAPSVNRTWLVELAHSANSTSGLILLPEPADVSLSEQPKAAGL